MARRVYLIRHGEVAFPSGGGSWCYGQTDLPLSERGREQMVRLGEWLSGAPPSRVYASDLARSRESARVLAERWGLSPTILPELREVHVGLWEGLGYEEIRSTYPAEVAKWAAGSSSFRFPGGESVRHLKARVLPLYHRLRAENPEGIIAIVGHAGPNRLILCDALGLPLTRLWRLGQDYGGLSIIDYQGDSAQVSTINFREGMPRE